MSACHFSVVLLIYSQHTSLSWPVSVNIMCSMKKSCSAFSLCTCTYFWTLIISIGMVWTFFCWFPCHSLHLIRVLNRFLNAYIILSLGNREQLHHIYLCKTCFSLRKQGTTWSYLFIYNKPYKVLVCQFQLLAMGQMYVINMVIL